MYHLLKGSCLALDCIIQIFIFFWLLVNIWNISYLWCSLKGNNLCDHIYPWCLCLFHDICFKKAVFSNINRMQLKPGSGTANIMNKYDVKKSWSRTCHVHEIESCHFHQIPPDGDNTTHLPQSQRYLNQILRAVLFHHQITRYVYTATHYIQWSFKTWQGYLSALCNTYILQDIDGCLRRGYLRRLQQWSTIRKLFTVRIKMCILS